MHNFNPRRIWDRRKSEYKVYYKEIIAEKLISKMLMYRSEMVNRDELIRQISARQIINKVIKVKYRENLKNKMMVYIERNDKIALTFH